MLSKHSGREFPGIFLIEGITGDDFFSSIGSALLEMVTIGDPIIIVTSTARLLGAVRNFAIDSDLTSIESFEDNLFMGWDLRGNGSWIKYENGPKKY
ncbi:MAG: hypothetical protein AB1502_00025 [Thermodesulfobacteriota bacterium]